MLDNDRFGFTDADFDAALESHGANNPVIRLSMYVPTHLEVRTLHPDKLAEILDLWFWEPD